jgi:hypothetical protein
MYIHALHDAQKHYSLFVSETCTLCTLFILFFPIPSDALIRPSNSNQPIEVAQLLVLSARLHRRTVVRPRIVKDNSTAKSQASPLKPTRIVSFQLNHTRANARGGVRAAHVSRGTATRPSRSPKPPLPAAYLYPSSSLCPSPCPARAAT